MQRFGAIRNIDKHSNFGVQACSTNLEELEAKIGQINRLTTECRQLDTKQKTMLDYNAQTLASLQVSSASHVTPGGWEKQGCLAVIILFTHKRRAADVT